MALLVTSDSHCKLRGKVKMICYNFSILDRTRLHTQHEYEKVDCQQLPKWHISSSQNNRAVAAHQQLATRPLLYHHSLVRSRKENILNLLFNYIRFGKTLCIKLKHVMSLYDVSKLKRLTTDFWFHMRHGKLNRTLQSESPVLVKPHLPSPRSLCKGVTVYTTSPDFLLCYHNNCYGD